MRLDVRAARASTTEPLGGIEMARRREVVGQGPRLVAGPGVERGDELRLLDQAVLQGEQAEEEMAVGGHGHTPGIPRLRAAILQRKPPIIACTVAPNFMHEGTRCQRRR